MSAIVIPFPRAFAALGGPESIAQRLARMRLSGDEALMALVICAAQVPELVARELDAIEAQRVRLGVPVNPVIPHPSQP